MRLSTRDRRSGMVLALVLVLGLVLSAALFTFMRRAVVDTLVVRNRDASSEAEALARGGVRLAMALLLEDLASEQAPTGGGGGGDTLSDTWAMVRSVEIPTREGAILRLKIEDAGARLNLNALVDPRTEAADSDDAEEFLTDFLTKVIDEIPLPPGEKTYDPRELARNLIDYIDPDDLRVLGGDENSYYQRQQPPYQAANRPLLSVEELRLIEGFDAPLLEALRPYVTVYPLVDGGGINLNTAPPHVLASVYVGLEGRRRLADEDMVRQILRVRQEGGILCDDTASGPECQPMNSVVEGGVFPAAIHPAKSEVFRVEATAIKGDIRRSVIAEIDRGDPTQPRLLSWRTR